MQKVHGGKLKGMCGERTSAPPHLAGHGVSEIHDLLGKETLIAIHDQSD